MAKAVIRLENVSLAMTRLSPDQVQSIFTKIAESENLKLTELDSGNHNLSSVPADVLVKAISRLETFHLNFSARERLEMVPSKFTEIIHFQQEQTMITLVKCKNDSE